MRFMDGQRSRLRSVKQADDKSDCFYRIHGYPIVIDTYNGYYPANLMDSDDATFWVSNSWAAAFPWATLDLGSAKIITKVRIYHDNSAGRATQVKLEVSNDNANWYLAYTSAVGIPFGELLFYPPALKYRYWKLTALARKMRWVPLARRRAACYSSTHDA